jgi:class 3 adenylate cyclase
VITVVFADLAGFTSQAETMDPEDVAALLDPYHAALKGELERFGGTVEKFIGDAVMAVFGAPVTHEDDPERAVRAALAIRDWAADTEIELRVGINTGEALVTLGAQPADGQAMAAGDVVNTAARLQSSAPLGGVLIGEQTASAVGSVMELGDEIAVEAKGKARPVRAWPVVRARARPHVERVHGSALVGREIDLLTGAFERARQERSPELVTLIGVPGIGKSRLVLELYGRIEQDPELTSWRSGRCLAYGDGITFWALGEMVKSEAGILEGDSVEECERKLAAIGAEPWIASHLRPLVGLAAVEAGGGARRDEAFTAWRRFLEQLAESRPLLLVFEDLHWADDDLLDFIDYLIDWATGVPLLVVCTARPELLTRRPGWGGGKPNALTVSLTPLSDGETDRLLAELLDHKHQSPEQHAELLARAGGNPLYAEEFVRMLREGGRIERVPETIQGLIAARLDLLDADQKTTVQNAAVVGKTFWLSPLAALDALDEGVLEQRLHALERKEFVRRERSSSIAEGAEYSFRHVLVRDVAYGQIPRGERAGKHLRAAEWIERLERPEDQAEMLAHHYLSAIELSATIGTDTKSFAGVASSALSDAGDRASALNAPGAAARYFRAALELLPGDDPSRHRLLLKLGYSLWVIDEPSAEMLTEAADGMRANGDPEGAAEAEARLAEHAWLDGDQQAAFSHLSRALELLEPLSASPVKAHAISTASRFRMLAGDDERAIQVGLDALAMAEELGLDDVRAAVLNNIGSSRFALGDRGGLDDLAEAVRVAGAANAPFELCRAKGNFAAQLWVSGELREAVESWEEALADATSYGQRSFERWVPGALLVPYYIFGRWDDLTEGAEAFLADVEAGRPHYLASQAYSSRAIVRFARGDDDGARADGELALAAGARAGDNQALLPTLARVAHIQLGLGNREGAREAAESFLEVVKRGRLGFETSSLHELAWTLTALGSGDELVDALANRRGPWSRAASAYASGQPASAAEIMGEIGALTEEAYARLAAGRRLIEENRITEADEQLGRALGFYRCVEATRYIDEIHTLRPDLRRTTTGAPGCPPSSRSHRVGGD